VLMVLACKAEFEASANTSASVSTYTYIENGSYILGKLSFGKDALAHNGWCSRRGRG
jgi:hypothetical protein